MEKLRNRARVDEIVSKTGLKIPADVSTGSYRWRAYLYANLFKGGEITNDDKATLLDLYRSILDVHQQPWSRGEMIPLDKNRLPGMQVLILRTLFSTKDAEVTKACLWQVHQFKEGNVYTDDNVVSLVPDLSKYRRSHIPQGE